LFDLMLFCMEWLVLGSFLYQQLIHSSLFKLWMLTLFFCNSILDLFVYSKIFPW
jgi:hypothetical protein